MELANFFVRDGLERLDRHGEANAAAGGDGVHALVCQRSLLAFRDALTFKMRSA
jgi:hypothetical protein